MKKTNVAGVSSMVAGGLVYGYRALSNFMGASSNLAADATESTDHVTLYESFPPGNFDWIDSIPWPSAKHWVDYVVNMPLWLILIIIGAFMLVVGGLFIKK